MKKIAATAAVAALMISSLNMTALAAEGETITYKDKAGITPDSILYPVDRAIEKLQLTLTVGDKNKINLIIDIAQERLGESEKMAEEGKSKLAGEAIEDSNDDLNKVSDTLLTEVKDDEDSSEADETPETAKKLEQTQQNSIEVLESLESKVGENAKDTIEKVIAMQTAKKDAVATMVQARHELNAARVAYKKVQKSGSDTEVTDAKTVLDGKQTAFDTARAAFKAAIKNNKVGIKDTKKNTEEVKDDSSDSEDTSTSTVKTEEVKTEKVKTDRVKSLKKVPSTPIKNKNHGQNGTQKGKK